MECRIGKGNPVKTPSQAPSKAAYGLLLTILLTLTLPLQAARDNWQRRDVDWQAGSGRQIKGIRYPQDTPLLMQSERQNLKETSAVKARKTLLSTSAKMTALAAADDDMLVESPPVDGFVPWIAVSVTKERNGELELEADVETWVRGSYPSGVDPDTDYIIGLLDTGASAHVMGYAAGVQAGVYNSLITASEVVVSGVTGSVVASVTQPLGIFVDGLNAIDPETLALDRSAMMGQSNVAIMVGQNPGTLPDLPTAIGSPLSVYFTTLIRNDNPLTIERDGETFTAPDIRLYEPGDPEAPRFATVIPLELRPLGGISVQYIPTLDMGLGGLDLDLDDLLGGGGFASDFPPASPSVIIGNSSQSLFFVHSVDL